MRWWRRESPASISPPEERQDPRWWTIVGTIVVPILVALIIASVHIVNHLLSVSSSLGSVEANIENLSNDVDKLQAGVDEVKDRVAEIEWRLGSDQPSSASWDYEEPRLDGW